MMWRWNSFVFWDQTFTWEIVAVLTIISHLHLYSSFAFSLLPSFFEETGVGETCQESKLPKPMITCQCSVEPCCLELDQNYNQKLYQWCFLHILLNLRLKKDLWEAVIPFHYNSFFFLIFSCSSQFHNGSQWWRKLPDFYLMNSFLVRPLFVLCFTVPIKL